MSHTWVKNPETGGVWACPDAAVEVAVARGWEPCDAPPEDESHLRDPAPAPEPESKPEPKKKSTTPSGD